MEGSRVEWTVPGLRETLNLPPGGVPNSFLRVTIGETHYAASQPAANGLLYAPVRDADGATTRARPVSLELTARPQWSQGRLQVSLRIPESVVARYADYRLVLEVALTSRSGQRLGAWPVRDWEAGARTLTLACPGSPDNALFETPLRAYLEPR